MGEGYILPFMDPLFSIHVASGFQQQHDRFYLKEDCRLQPTCIYSGSMSTGMVLVCRPLSFVSTSMYTCIYSFSLKRGCLWRSQKATFVLSPVQSFAPPTMDYRTTRDRLATQKRNSQKGLSKLLAKTRPSRSIVSQEDPSGGYTGRPCSWSVIY